MTNFAQLAPILSDRPVPVADSLRLAVATYLACFTGSSREHTGSDLRCYFTWCAERDLDLDLAFAGESWDLAHIS